jgi:membrane glycosyltransferase
MSHRPRGKVDAVEATAAMKINEAESINEAVGFMNAKERAIVLATPELFKSLAALPKGDVQ